MQLLQTRWNTWLDRQHRNPAGVAGHVVGEKMVRQHAPETLWTVEQLAIKPADRVLELGFGAGRGLALSTQRATDGYVVGVDLSPAMLRSAALRNQATLRAGRLALLRADLAALPFDSPRFDRVFSIHTLYFWPEPLDVFAQILRLLRPGGTLITTFSTGYTLPNGEQVWWDVQAHAEAMVQTLRQWGGLAAELRSGPDSRQYNSRAIVVQRQ